MIIETLELSTVMSPTEQAFEPYAWGGRAPPPVAAESPPRAHAPPALRLTIQLTTNEYAVWGNFCFQLNR